MYKRQGLNDETNRKGMRIVVDVRKDANAQVILNQLYQYTQLQDTVGVIMLAIDHKVPKVMTLKQMIQKYVEFQDEVVRRRTQYDLKKAKERAHILEGLKKATDIVDELIATIRACKGGMSEAKTAIMEQFGFDDPQADAIVKLQLGRLAGLEILKIEEELSGLQAKIEEDVYKRQLLQRVKSSSAARRIWAASSMSSTPSARATRWKSASTTAICWMLCAMPAPRRCGWRSAARSARDVYKRQV